MKLHSKYFDIIAGLSMLEFFQAEKQELLEKLNKLLAEVVKLNDFDVSDEKVLIRPDSCFNPGGLREDNPILPCPQRIVLENAPKVVLSYIVVNQKHYI